MRKRCILSSIFILLLAVGGARGQEVSTLTLEEAIRIAQKQSPSAAAAKARLSAARLEREMLAAQKYPSFSLHGSLPGLERSINEVTQPDGSVEYIPQSRLSSTTRLGVTQRLPWTGTEIFVSSRLGRLDVFGDQDFTQWNAAPIAIGVTQPLFAFNEFQWQRRLAPIRLEVARRSYAETTAQIAEEATRHFFGAYLAQVAAETAAANVATNDTIYAIAQRRYRIGSLAEHELLQSELQLINAQDALASAEANEETAMRDLKMLLGIGRDVRLSPPTKVPSFEVNPEEAVQHAQTLRPDFAQLRLQTQQARQELARAESETGFSASITASFGLNQRGSTFEGAFRDPLNQQRLGIDFSLPIFQWGQGDARVEAAQAAVAEARAAAEEERQNLSQEVYAEAVQLRTLKKRLELAEEARRVAQERFLSAKERYMIGSMDLTDLFNAQEERDQALRTYYERLRALWTSYYHLRSLTLYDAVTGQPVSEIF